MTWEPSDSARLREYHQKSGGKLRAFFQSQIPIITGKNIEQVALEAMHKQGCEFMLKQLDDLLADNPAADDASSGAFTSM